MEGVAMLAPGALVIGLVYVLRMMLNVDTKFLPGISILIGIVVMCAMNIGNITVETVLLGVSLGLVSSGVWDNIKAVGKIKIAAPDEA